MALPPAFWRRLSYLLIAALSFCLIRMHILNGFPQEWNKVQIGMTISQVRDLCGKPSSSSGMKPDRWEVPFLWGAWVLCVGHDEFNQGPHALVESIEVFFDHRISNIASMHHYCRLQLRDHDAFYTAFGQERTPTPQQHPPKEILSKQP